MRYRARVSKRLIEHEFVHVFGGISDQAPTPAASEAAAWRWMSLDDVISDVDLRPRLYTVWFKKILRDFSAEIARFSAS
jgi:isopentenyl-diphosphate delta-isomerase